MRLILIHQGVRYDIEARFEKPGSHVSDLVDAIERRAGTIGHTSGLFVDDLFRPGDTEIEEAGLHEGAVVALTSSTPADRLDEDLPEEGSLALTVVTGPDAGQVVPLSTNGEYRIGRGPDCHIRLLDPTLSRLHCALQVSAVDTVTVVNLSATVGTRIAGATITSPQPVALGTPITLGTTTIVVDRSSHEDRMPGFHRARRLGPAGTISFNRPPRVAPEPLDISLDPPMEPQDAGKPPFNVVSMAAPAAMGLVMVFAFHSALYAMFALLSPIMVAGNWWESRHRSSKALRTSTRNYARDLVGFEGTLSESWHREVDHRRAATPNLAEVARRARLPSVHLWERRPSHEDFLRLSIGFSDVEWKPGFTGERRRPLLPTPQRYWPGIASCSTCQSSPTSTRAVWLASPAPGMAPWRWLAGWHARPRPCTARPTCAWRSSSRRTRPEGGSGPSGCRTPGTRPAVRNDDWSRRASETPPRCWRR